MTLIWDWTFVLTWSLPDGAVSQLEIPEGYTYAWPMAMSESGVVVGYSWDLQWRALRDAPCRWDDKTVTVLPNRFDDRSAFGGSEYPYGASDDGSVIVGPGHYEWVRWPNDGTVKPFLGLMRGSDVGGPRLIDVYHRLVSYDGRITYGSSDIYAPSGGGYHTTVWTDTVPEQWPGGNAVPMYPRVADGTCMMCDVSGDGKVFIGGGWDGQSSTPWNYPGGYWKDKTFYTLTMPIMEFQSYAPRGKVMMCNGDGSVIWGGVLTTTDPSSIVPCYWDNLTNLTGNFTPSVGTTVLTYGVYHIADTFQNWHMEWVADTATVAVGWSYDSVRGRYSAIKWVGTTGIVLPPLEPGQNARAYGCSGDGSIVVGDANTFQGQRAVWWDANNVIHELPNGTCGNYATALGVNRAGTKVWGTGDGYPEKPEIYVFYNDSGADFDTTFSQISLSVWCCKNVVIQGPGDVDTTRTAFRMAFTPAQATLWFRDEFGVPLFNGQFNNPDTPDETKAYNVLFSLDTQAQTYTFYGNGVPWTPVSVSFPNTGEINNQP